MAQAQMQCQECRVWFNVSQRQRVVPNHTIARGGQERTCSGGGKIAYHVKGFDNPPPEAR